MSAPPLAFGPFILDMDRGTLSREGRRLSVGHKGLLLLHALLQSSGKPVDKASLMDVAWPGIAVEESNLSVQIAALRKLLGPTEDGGEWIATVPRIGYRFAGSTGRVSAAGGPSDRNEPVAEQRPSIAVLPFSMATDGADKEYIADGITEDIITALARFRWFRVTARSSSFAYKGKSMDVRQIARQLGVRYVLEGTVRHSTPRQRISTRLIDATTGSHLWAERYDVEMTEIFAIQDEIAERVAGAIEPELLKTESRPATTRHTGNATAWDFVRQGTWHFHKITAEGHLAARNLFRQACATDPDLPESHIWLARVSAGIVGYGWSSSPATDLREGMQAAAKAIYLDGKDPYAHYSFAIVSAYADAPSQAALAAERAIELSPSFALGHLVLGMARLYGGQAADAIEPLEHGLRLNPNDPQNFVWYNLLAFAKLFSSHPQQALTDATKALAIRPTWRPSLETLICCKIALGRLDEADRCATRHAELEKPAGDIFGPFRRLNPAWQCQIVDALSKVGIRQ
jgi:TolB-like protein